MTDPNADPWSNTAIATVAEPVPPWSEETVLLFASIAVHGGRMAAAPRLAYFTGPIEGELANQLARLGVVVKIVSPVDPSYPIANKLLMFVDDELDGVLGLDTDVLVMGDASGHLGGTAVAAHPADQDPLRPDQWQRLFGHFDIPLPAARFLTTFFRTEVLPYFNSGVVLLPSEVRAPVASRWCELTMQLLDAYDHLGDIAEHRLHTDQFALALALADLGVAVRPLPLELNFPTHHPVAAEWRPHQVRPLILHHHHRRAEDGRFRRSGYGPTDELLERAEQLRELDAGGVTPGWAAPPRSERA